MMRNAANAVRTPIAKPVALLAVERGAEFGSWLDGFGDRADSFRLIAQREDESASAFAARVRSEVAQLEGDLADAVLVGALATDPEVLGARALIVRAMSAKMSHDGRLFLDGSGRTRLAMHALAQICADQLVGVQVMTEAREPAALPLAA